MSQKPSKGRRRANQKAQQKIKRYKRRHAPRSHPGSDKSLCPGMWDEDGKLIVSF